MPIIAIQGIRGGVGTTSIAAGLAHSLHALGESVLVIDLCCNHLLPLHFNGKIDQKEGWMRAISDQTPWHESAFEYLPNLNYLPFGKINVQELRLAKHFLMENPKYWQQQLKKLSYEQYPWIIIDCSHINDDFMHHIEFQFDFKLFILNADTACHVILHRHQDQLRGRNLHFLINQFSPHSALQQDLSQLWQNTMTNLIPLNIHKNEAFLEAFAQKQPIGEYLPSSLATQEIQTLASWCLIHCQADARDQSEVL